jgi:hypothetical protein
MFAHDKPKGKPKDKPDPDKLKQDLELLETALSDPLADSLLKETPRKLRAVKPGSDDKKKKK